MRLLTCWDCVFEYRRWHGSFSLVNVVSCAGREVFTIADPSSRGDLSSVYVSLSR
jgi:hypothetical protein